MKENPSKQKVMKAASALFFQKGFHGTSVRDIAHKANMNISSINYYFKSKQGLLEYTVTTYYEAYLKALEKTITESETLAPIDRLNMLISTIIHYKQSNYQLTCFIQRELSLDSIFVREMTVTYLAKENYIIRETFYDVLEGRVKIDFKHYLLIQLKGMLVTPYILHNDWKDQVLGEYSHQLFVKRYVRVIQQWLDFIILHGMQTERMLAQ